MTEKNEVYLEIEGGKQAHLVNAQQGWREVTGSDLRGVLVIEHTRVSQEYERQLAQSALLAAQELGV